MDMKRRYKIMNYIIGVLLAILFGLMAAFYSHKGF